MKNFFENRASTRTSMESPITFDYCEPLAGRFSNATQRGNCVNISEGGIGLEIHHEIKGNDVVKLYIPFGVAQTNVPVFCLVRWIRPNDQHFKVGLRFLG